MSAITGILAFALLFASSLVSALQVTPGSPCASACLDDKNGNPIDVNASTTGLNDIVCNDIDFHSSLVGTKYRTCLECLQNSTKSEGPETDTSWYLYNVKYAVDVCLYSFPNATQGSSSPCSLAPNCGSLQRALEMGNLRPNESAYDYCTADNGAFGGEAVNSCSQCLQATSEQKYMSNFITALAAGCKQKPVPGTALSLRGSLFSTSTPLAIVEPSTNNQTVTTSQTATTALTTGAIVGIVVGASLLLLGGLALFFVHWRRQRRYAREYEDPKPPSNKTSGSYSTITTNRLGGRPSPCYTTDHKEGLPAYEAHDPRDYTNNADYYDRMDNYYEPSNNLSVLPAHPAYIPRTHARASRAASPSLDPQQSQQHRPQKSYPTSILSHSVAAPASDYPSTKISPPPPNPHPRRVSPQSRYVHPSQRPSPPMAPSQGAAQPPPPPPPPPPREPTLSLVMPSVSNLRGPKRYAPPKIEVQGATPINEQADINISLPISYPEERFREGRERHNNAGRRPPSPSDSIVEQTVERPLPRQYKEMPIGSGKSTLYG